MQLQLVNAIVRRGDIVFDIGASRCFFAERFVQLVGRNGMVMAFEPNPDRRADLDALVRGRSNVFAYNMGLSDKKADSLLHVPVIAGRTYSGSACLTPERLGRSGICFEARSIHLEPLDDINLPDRPNVSFIKIDVEGHELEVLRGGSQTIAASKPVLMIEIEQRHHENSITDIFEHVVGYGYEGYVIHPGGLRPLNEFDIERDQLRFYMRDRYVPVIRDEDYLNDFLFVKAGVSGRISQEIMQRTAP